MKRHRRYGDIRYPFGHDKHETTDDKLVGANFDSVPQEKHLAVERAVTAYVDTVWLIDTTLFHEPEKRSFKVRISPGALTALERYFGIELICRTHHNDLGQCQQLKDEDESTQYTGSTWRNGKQMLVVELPYCDLSL